MSDTSEAQGAQGRTGADAATAARLYALLAGGAMTIGGIAGFLYEPSFATGDELKADDILSTFPTNGWDNLLHLLAGLTGLALASRAASAYSLVVGALLTLLALWGFAATDNGSGTIAGLLPVGDSDNLLHLAVGLCGIGAGLASGGLRPRLPAPRRRRAAPEAGG